MMIWVLALIAIVVVGIFAMQSFSSSDETVQTGKISGNAVDTNQDSSDSVKVFVVDSSHLRFYIDGVENPDIKVNQGDKVRIEFTSSEGFHDWKVDEFNAATAKINPGNKTSVEFVADKAGTYEYYCSVGKHRQNGMKGNLIVE